jgi:hypothetical protein
MYKLLNTTISMDLKSNLKQLEFRLLLDFII